MLSGKEFRGFPDEKLILSGFFSRSSQMLPLLSHSVQVLLLEKEQQHLDKTQNWRRKIDPLVIWISSAENKLNTQFEIAPDLDTVKKQKNDLVVKLNIIS